MTGVPDRLGVGERGESRVSSWFWPEHQEGGHVVHETRAGVQLGVGWEERCRLDIQVEVGRRRLCIQLWSSVETSWLEVCVSESSAYS